MSTHDTDYYRTLILRTIGNFLILSSLFMIGKTFYQPIREEVRYYFNERAEKEYVVASTQEEGQTIIERDFSPSVQSGSLKKLKDQQNVEVMVPVDPQYSLVIPKIGANAPVIPNVNAADREEYLAALGGGIAHAEGTAFPGEGGHMFLFAHSTDYIWNVGTYNAVFYLLYKLEEGDEVNLFYEGERFTYRVTGKQVIDPSEVEYLTRKTDKEFLTLQTCWPLGTTLKRQLVFAERVSDL